MTRSQAEEMIAPIFFLDVQCPALQLADKNILATENIQNYQNANVVTLG
jgi:hypothetical protein